MRLGYSTRVGEYADRPLIVVLAVDSWEQTRWTVAHELVTCCCTPTGWQTAWR